MIPDWFRVDCDIVDSPKVGRLADVLRVDVAKALGHVIAVFARVRQQRAADGSFVDVSDTTLEQWALWTGKRGRFAAAFRAAFVCDDVLSGWEERQAPLIRRVLAERERAKQNRQRARTSDEDTPDGTPTSTRTRTRTVLRQQEQVQEQVLKPSVSHPREPDLRVIPTDATWALLNVRLPESYRPDLESLLDGRPARERVAWCARLAAHLDGMHGPVVPPDALGEAIRQFNANGAIGTRLFDGYVRRVLAPVPTGPPVGHRNAFASRETAGQEAYDTALAVAEEFQRQARGAA